MFMPPVSLKQLASNQARQKPESHFQRPLCSPALPAVKLPFLLMQELAPTGVQQVFAAVSLACSLHMLLKTARSECAQSSKKLALAPGTIVRSGVKIVTHLRPRCDREAP